MSISDRELRKRVIYVTDRIIFGVSLVFIFLISYITIMLLINTIPSNIWFYLILSVNIIISWILYAFLNEEFYFSESIFLNPNFFLVANIGISFSIVLSNFFAAIYSWNHILFMTILYLFLFVIGYFIGRTLWREWKNFKIGTKRTILLVFIGITLLIVFLANIILTNQLFGAPIVWFIGIGILISIGSHVFTFKLFIDESGNDVLEDPPSMLVIIGIVNTYIISMIIWILMIILIPLFGVSKKKSSRSGSTYKSKTKGKRYRKRMRGYPYRKYLLFGSYHERKPTEYYWQICLGNRKVQTDQQREKVDKVKKQIINELKVEEVVPTGKDLRNSVNVGDLTFDLALAELLDEQKLKYTYDTQGHWWSKGFTLTGKYATQLYTLESGKITITEDQIEEFVKEIQKNEPVKNRGKLWELGVDLGLRPKWQILRVIVNLKKEGRLKYSYTKPGGWSIINNN